MSNPNPWIRVQTLIMSLALVLIGTHAFSQGLEQQLLAVPPETLAEEAAQFGDARRGAIVFFQPYLACVKCHGDQASRQRLGPDLSAMQPQPSDQEIVDSVLRPSKVIKKGFETLTLLLDDGQIVQGTLVERSGDVVVLRDAAAESTKRVSIPVDQIVQQRVSETSSMPAGQVNVLASRQQFLDLIRYLMEIRDGGAERARELEPSPALYASAALPEYEKHIDHAGMISGFDPAARKRGEAIYARVCANCHGTHDRPGSLPTSLNFSTGKFKNGNDPYTMYQTLTRGFGLMVPQTWMVPQQKYDVIHYIREDYLQPVNPSQYAEIDESYLASLPKGDTRGPEPSKIEPWRQMDYGDNLIATYEIGEDGTNFAYKGNALRLDPGPGGVSRGHSWMVFDYDTLRMAAAWTGEEFIDYNGINFNGSHGTHPRVAGTVQFANPTGPGWARPGTDSFEDPRLIGRDDRRDGPLPRDWVQYRGMYYHGRDTIIAYTVGTTDVLETACRLPGESQVFGRRFEIGPRSQDMLLNVTTDSTLGDKPLIPINLPAGSPETLSRVVLWGNAKSNAVGADDQAADSAGIRLDGSVFLQITDADSIDLDTRDYTILARLKTSEDGTIFCKTEEGPKWVPNGKTFFIRQGRLCFDIGWVGSVRSDDKVTDNRWHDVAMTFNVRDNRVSFYIDGMPSGGGRLVPQTRRSEQVARIGFTAKNFPERSPFLGELDRVEFIQAELSAAALRKRTRQSAAAASHPKTLAVWRLANATGDSVVNALANSKQSNRQRDGATLNADVIRDPSLHAGAESAAGPVLAGLASSDAFDLSGLRWGRQGDRIQLRIPAGDKPLRFTLWMTRLGESQTTGDRLAVIEVPEPWRDLSRMTHGGPPRWPQAVTTIAQIGQDRGPFAVDTLTYPLVNPWQCRMRLTGHDFFSDPDRAAVCDWDGNVWLVTGLNATRVEGTPPQGIESRESEGPPLQWKRIASGLFQPLGLRIIDDVIHVTCRDQLARLHDLNGDGAIDWYECVNNDHQVTDHFHEFAMGLQTDAEGNFYYAKSARHALPALVPHHGTLLRISSDGRQTEILANGFRAANGVCLNSDGTFIVTDQEGHWNPKNRINWVKKGGFYGNMFGYHDVTDESDEAMEQPLCWITNQFDRSPAELLWVTSDQWGPLTGRLLSISYGYGKVFLVPHESVDGQMQGGMIELPIPPFPTGTIRGRFAPSDGQLYLTGMFAWAGSRNEPGGFYRLRYTGRPLLLPVELHATTRGISMEFTDDLQRVEAENLENYDIKVWDLKRTAQYGSEHYNEHGLSVSKATLNGRTVHLEIPDIAPTWCMEIRYRLKSRTGKPVVGTIHNTIHHLGQPDR